MRHFPMCLALFAGILAALPAAADVGVPPARVNNPDLDSLQIVAAWTQIKPDTPAGQPVPDVELRYVLTIPAGETAQTVCTAPALDISGLAATPAITTRATLQGHTRHPSQTYPPETPEAQKTYVRDTAAYTVAICAADLNAAATEVIFALNGQPATLYQGDPSPGAPVRMARLRGPALLGARTAGGTAINAVFLSDTGCRGQDPGETRFSRFWQDCFATKGNEYPGHPSASYGFPAVSRMVADAAPDFVMHGGDHHYFYENADYWLRPDLYPTSVHRFEYWLQEFLVPAQAMLLESPFVFARGNHERCNTPQWSGTGWFALFGPPGVADCPATDWTPTWSFTIAPRNTTAVPPFEVFVIDSAAPRQAQASLAFGGKDGSGRDVAPNPSGPVRDKLWLTHYPPVKNEYYSGGTHDIGDRSIRHAVADALQTYCPGQTTCWPNTVLAGHQHLFQRLRISSDAAGAPVATEVVIAGHGGTRWDTSSFPGAGGTTQRLVTCDADYAGRTAFFPQGSGRSIKAEVTTASQYGFVTLRRDGTSIDSPMGWTLGTVWWPKGSDPVPGGGGGC